MKMIKMNKGPVMKIYRVQTNLMAYPGYKIGQNGGYRTVPHNHGPRPQALQNMKYSPRSRRRA